MSVRQKMCKTKGIKGITKFSLEKFCEQLKQLYDLLEKRKKEILADPNFNPTNSQLNDELEKIYRRLELVQECLNEFCP